MDFSIEHRALGHSMHTVTQHIIHDDQQTQRRNKGESDRNVNFNILH